MVKIGSLRLGTYPLLLAPMEDVSDPPFRALCKSYGADLMFTEFISSEGLIRHAQKSVKKLDIFSHERPIGIQIFGNDISSMREAARLAEVVEPDLIDINYGCPVKKVACRGSGAGILLDLPKMQAMTSAIVDQVSCPVTVKTRLGWDEYSIRIQEVALRLQDAGIQALSIHGRTRKQMYKGSANWSYIAEVKSHPDIEIPIFGNGDIDSPQKAKQYKDKYQLDGAMVGRAAIGAPWIFSQIKHYLQKDELLPSPGLSERVEAIRRHLSFSLEWKGARRAVFELRRHYGRYLQGTPTAKTARMKLMQADTESSLQDILEHLLNSSSVPFSIAT